MNTFRRLTGELVWLAAAGLLAWFFPKTVLVITLAGAAVTITLRLIEKGWQ